MSLHVFDLRQLEGNEYLHIVRLSLFRNLIIHWSEVHPQGTSQVLPGLYALGCTTLPLKIHSVTTNYVHGYVDY